MFTSCHPSTAVMCVGLDRALFPGTEQTSCVLLTPWCQRGASSLGTEFSSKQLESLLWARPYSRHRTKQKRTFFHSDGASMLLGDR